MPDPMPPEFASDAPTSLLSGQMVVIPSHLASRLFHCYYGAGPRHYESSSTAELVPADELRALRSAAAELLALRRSASPTPTPSPTTPPPPRKPSYPPGVTPQGLEATHPMGTV